MKTILSIIGGVVAFLWLLGALGFGEFRLYYGQDSQEWLQNEIDQGKTQSIGVELPATIRPGRQQ